MKVLVQADLQNFPFVRFKFIGVASTMYLWFFCPLTHWRRQSKDVWRGGRSGVESDSKWIYKIDGEGLLDLFVCENCIEYLTDDNSLGVG